MKEKIAIIGGGIGGLMAAYLLDKKYEITLFEKDSRLGGNAYTLNTKDGNAFDVSVFAFSESTYPNFFKLLSELKVEYDSMRLGELGVTYYNLDKKKVNVFAPFSMNLRYSIPSFFSGIKMGRKLQLGLKMFDQGKLDGLTTGEALDSIPGLGKGLTYFRIVGIICLAASMYFEEVLASPAAFFFGKLQKHFTAGDFRVLKNKTQSYVGAMTDAIEGEILLNSNIQGVERSEKEVTVRLKDGDARNFDKVVFACNADQVLNLLETPTEEETELLGKWKYKDGLVVVHQDYSSFPDRSLLRMYDYLYTCRDGKYETSINATYGRQSGVSKDCMHLGTQHPNFPIDEKLVEFKKVFRTPIYDPTSFATTDRMPSLNGKMNSYHCGSHFGYGLHEDAVRSAVAVAAELGVQW
ncbi:MAG: NAD(P)-binding protein [Proteobacteria bacterium]|nr:NAD(P)-binding protein [Pseudomonadota bacterium]